MRDSWLQCSRECTPWPGQQQLGRAAAAGYQHGICNSCCMFCCAAAHLNGVGECQTDSSGTQLHTLSHSEDADSQHQDGTVQVAVEGQPQVQGLSVEQGAVVLVDLVGSGGNEVLVLAEGSDDGQALQGLSNQTDQVTCTEGSAANSVSTTVQKAVLLCTPCTGAARVKCIRAESCMFKPATCTLQPAAHIILGAISACYSAASTTHLQSQSSASSGWWRQADRSRA
jgi:hypothetical protein